jgi:hypothetical protein
VFTANRNGVTSLVCQITDRTIDIFLQRTTPKDLCLFICRINICSNARISYMSWYIHDRANKRIQKSVYQNARTKSVHIRRNILSYSKQNCSNKIIWKWLMTWAEYYLPGKMSTVRLKPYFTSSLDTYRYTCMSVFKDICFIQGDFFGTRPTKMRISQRLFIIQFNIL